MDYEKLEKLASLKEKGLISEAEFQAEKRKLMNQNKDDTSESKQISLWKYYKSCMTGKFFFDFSGRTTRKEYWSFILFNYLATSGINIIAYIVSGGDMCELKRLTISILCYLLFLPASLGVYVRRCHDIGMSAWMGLLIIPLFTAMFKKGNEGKNQYAPQVYNVNYEISDEGKVWIIVFFVLLILRIAI